MDPFVVEMHTRSGLLGAIRASTVTLDQAGAATLAFIREHVLVERTVPLCGNSIGTDRRFLAAYLPDIENYLHYRSVDVSSVKELVRRWYPTVRAQRPRKAGSHRALDDIRESVAELRYYRERVFVAPAAVAPRRDDVGAGHQRAGAGRHHRAARIGIVRPFHRTGRRSAVSTTDRRNTTRKKTTSAG